MQYRMVSRDRVVGRESAIRNASRFGASFVAFMAFLRCFSSRELMLHTLVTFCFKTASSLWIREMHTLSCLASCIEGEKNAPCEKTLDGGNRKRITETRSFSFVYTKSRRRKRREREPFFSVPFRSLVGVVWIRNAVVAVFIAGMGNILDCSTGVMCRFPALRVGRDSRRGDSGKGADKCGQSGLLGGGEQEAVFGFVHLEIAAAVF